MAENDCSPKWKRPSDVMRKHRKKKRLSLQPVSNLEKPSLSDVLSPNNAFNININKRRNPFSQSANFTESPSKRRRNSTTCDDENSNSCCSEKNTQVLFTILDKKLGDSETELKVVKSDQINLKENYTLDDDDSKSQFDFIEKFFSPNKSNSSTKPKVNFNGLIAPEIKENNLDYCELHVLPIDWSLKVKLRFLSENSLQWCSQIRSSDEAKGVRSFVKGQSPNADNVQELTESQKKILLQQNSMYWMYPNLPWVKLFPRIVPESKLRSGTNLFLDEFIQSSLQKEWSESFTSVFHQLRAQECPYFYLLTHQFTVLFRAAGVTGLSTISALLTPTTRGFREALKAEDIEFSMPALEKRKSISSTLKKTDEEKEKVASNREDTPQQGLEDDDDDEFLNTDEGASVWLESIGLDKKSFPSLDPNKVKIQREGFRVIDNRPESMVFVKGGDVQALFNFLINCRSCTATSGAQAGVPPTIISPMAFQGASLKTHKVKHSLVRQMGVNGNVSQVHLVEVIGPVLPHHVVNYCDTFSQTQAGDFTLTLNTHEPSVPFNIDFVSEKCEPTNPEVLRLNTDMVSQRFDSFFTSKPLNDKLSATKEIHCEKKKYTVVL